MISTDEQAHVSHPAIFPGAVGQRGLTENDGNANRQLRRRGNRHK
jgi:hypothetical protein